jgi:hypothetical protein
MSDLDRLNYNITVAKAQQDARHAAEEGRDLARERCVEAMRKAVLENTGNWHSAMDAALDAALATGYVIISRP